MGHMARDCRAPRQSFRGGGPQRRGRGGYRVAAINQRRLGPVLEEEEEAQASGYTPHTAGCICSAALATHAASPFSQVRKLSAVPGDINGYHISQILVDSGSPVTIIR